MFEEFLLLIGLLLSLYGLSCIISSVVMWFVSCRDATSHVHLVFITEQDCVKAKVGTVLEKLKNNGLIYITSVLVVDCDLSPVKQDKAREYCYKKEIGFCKREELSEYLKKPSFQIPENTV